MSPINTRDTKSETKATTPTETEKLTDEELREQIRIAIATHVEVNRVAFQPESDIPIAIGLKAGCELYRRLVTRPAPAGMREALEWIRDQRWNDNADLDEICARAEAALSAPGARTPEDGMSKEKVYCGSFDGSHRYIVRSTSWERATVAFQACGLNVSVHAARASGSISGNVQEQMMTRDHLDIVFRRPCNGKDDWERAPGRQREAGMEGQMAYPVPCLAWTGCVMLAKHDRIKGTIADQPSGIYERSFGGWKIRLNGRNETNDGVPPFTAMVFWNGWPAGEIEPGGGIIAAGALANEDSFIAAIEAELGRSIEEELSTPATVKQEE